MRELTPVAEEEAEVAAVEANPDAIWEAADKGDMAVVRKHIEAGVTAVKKVQREKSDEFNNKYRGYFEKYVAAEEDEADVNALTLATENAAEGDGRGGEDGRHGRSCASSSRPGWRWTAKVMFSVYELKSTALIQAATGNQTKMSKFLVTRGADANAKHKNGTTAMMRAAMHGNTELVGY